VISFVPTRSDVRATLRLAAPVVAVQLGMMTMGLVDTAFVGRVSTEALAAVGVGNLWSWGSMVFGLGVLLAVGPLLAQAHGAGDRDGFGRTLRRGLVIGLGTAVLATVLQLVAEPGLLLFGQDPALAEAAAEYVHRTIPGTLGFYVFAVLREALQSVHRLRPLVLTIVGANILNVVADYAMVLGHLGFPALGANGAAWATALARTVMALGVAVAGWPVLRDALRGWSVRDLAPRPLLGVTQLGLPIGGQMFLEFGGFGGVMILMGHIGTAEVAAHQVTIFAAAMAFMVPLGVSQAAGVLVGNAIGSEDTPGARRAAGASMIVGTAWMCLTAALFMAFPEAVARVLTDEPEVIAIAVTLVPLAGVFQVPDGIQVVAGGILRGIADVRVPFGINLVAFWVVSLPFGWWLTFRQDAGPAGLWWGLVGGLGVAAVLLTVRAVVKLSQDVARTVVD
jgi:MATE family multidrug resistance protein